MAVKWWILTENKQVRFMLSQMAPFGIRFDNSILYRAETDKILDQERPSLTGLILQGFGPDDWEITKALSQRFDLVVGTCARSNVLFAFQDGVAVGHICSQKGRVLISDIDREEEFEDGIYLHNLFIAPSVRRRGVGKLLMFYAVENAVKDATHRYVYSYVRTENFASRRMVESLGFEATKVTHFLKIFRMSSYWDEATTPSFELETRNPPVRQ